MGCDIHPAIEYKQDGTWKALLTKNPNFGKQYYEEESEMTARINIGRDYDLFGILGNVRNGRGFAGIDTGDGFDPMSDCRGVPEDISPEALQALSDEHSATYVTLAEILDYDWNRSSINRGVVDAATFLDWDWMKEYQPAPAGWSGDVSGRDVVHISEEAMREKVTAIRANRHGRDEKAREDVAAALPHTYTRISWPVSYAKAGRQLWEKVLPLMLNLGREYGYENVRLVMDFDS